MKMDAVYGELDEAKSEIEKLREQYKIKAELVESLKKAQIDQQCKAKEANSQLEKLAQELNEKNDELFTANNMNEELKSNLAQKESIIKNITSSHDKLQVDSRERLRKCTEENRNLFLSLDESNARNINQERELGVLKQEIERVKGILTVTQKKFTDIESKVSKESWGREDTLVKLEEEKRNFEEQLKWKSEQFQNLKEAHEKLLNQFRVRETQQEEEEKVLALYSVDQNSKTNDCKEISVLRLEIEGLKKLLSISKNKCSESENRASDKKESEGDIFEKLNEENQKFKNQLKWKNEQFDHLKEAHEKLLKQFKIKEGEWDDNIRLVASPDEGNLKNAENEHQISVLREEIEGLKRLLSDSQKQHSDIENKASKERGGKEDVFLKLEEENEKFQSQLKWKKEQFCHLQEAHEKLRGDFKMSEKEWEKERARLLDGISTLETKLDSQIRTSQDLQRRLEMCNQALAHAESRRKLLEVQLSESKKDFDGICGEFEDAKSKFEMMNAQRDQEIATLRSEFTRKDVLCKEMEYQFRKVEQDKEEMLQSLRELQEARIHDSGKVSSASKVQKKLKSLENVHKGCLANLQAKESEWFSRIEKLAKEVSFYKLKEEELRLQLEARDSLILKLELLNQESSFMILVLQSEFSEVITHCRSTNRKSEDISETKASFERMERDLMEEREKRVVLSHKVLSLEDSLEILYQESSLMLLILKSEFSEVITHCRATNRKSEDISETKAAFEKLERDLMEEHEKRVVLSQNVLSLEDSLEILYQESSVMLLILKSEFSEVLKSENKASTFERLERDLNEEREKRVILSERVKKLNEMFEESSTCRTHSEKQVMELKSELEKAHHDLKVANDEANLKFHEGNELEFELQVWKSLVTQLESNLERTNQMRRDIEASLLAQMEVELSLKQEKESLTLLLEEKEKKIDDLQTEISKTKNEEENWLKNEYEQLVEEKDQRISDLQQLVANLEKEFESSTSSFSSRLFQMQEETNLIREKIKEAEAVKDIEIQEKNMMIAKLESDLVRLVQLSEKIEQSSVDEMKLMQCLEKMVQTDGARPEEYDPVKENMNVFTSPIMKRSVEESSRSPLRALN